MARALRLEAEGGVYHVLNRGNYRAPIFQSDRTKAAFLKCLDEACAKTGWRIHAWCLMSNHYHLALTTPEPNLVEGMRWLQGTFALRFNRFRREHGHLFQGRYKSLVVDSGDGLGPLCHYIHLNPAQAQLCSLRRLPVYRWTSFSWLRTPRRRPAWFDPLPALDHAGQLSDTLAGHARYLDYLEWLAEDEPARKKMRFDRMTKGWAIGSAEFVRTLAAEQRELRAHGRRRDNEMRASHEAVWADELDHLLARLQRGRDDLVAATKFAPWKVAVAAVLKSRTTATNRWLMTHLRLGCLHETSRQVSAWNRSPDPRLARRLA